MSPCIVRRIQQRLLCFLVILVFLFSFVDKLSVPQHEGRKVYDDVARRRL
jgi:hypothetical protein